MNTLKIILKEIQHIMKSDIPCIKSYLMGCTRTMEVIANMQKELVQEKRKKVDAEASELEEDIKQYERKKSEMQKNDQ